MAEFYSNTAGMAELTGKLRKNVEEGYSVLIFPEGTRSPDTHIRRFHQGAFQLAKELDLEILPVIIHGSGDIMTKGEYFLRTGNVVIKVLPRFRIDEMIPGESILEKTRSIRKYFTEEYRQVAMVAENPSYFRKRLIKNYLYKGPVLEWYLRIKIRLEKDYEFFHRYLPESGRITDIGCGYGFMSYMLSFLSENRIVTGIDYDRDKIDVANNCPAKNERISFICGDATKVEIPSGKGMILADVLHYFPENEQEKLLVRCIEMLEEGGVMIIRDGDRQMGRKHFGTRLSEFFSTNIGFNKTMDEKKELYFTSREKIESILKRYNLNIEIVDETKLTSNIILIAKKQQ
jgi:SAM-dependent methyltransferase